MASFGLHERIQSLQEADVRCCLADTIRQTEKSHNDRKVEASTYATTARLGQGFVTSGNLVALATLLNQAEHDIHQRHVIKGLIISSLVLSSILIVLQLLLAGVHPPSTTQDPDASIWWQALYAFQGLMRNLLHWVCWDSGAKKETTLAHGDDEPINIDATQDHISLPLNAEEHVGAPGGSDQRRGEIEQHLQSIADVRLFTTWQEDLNMTITVLGGVVTILNSVTAGLMSTNPTSTNVPASAPA